MPIIKSCLNYSPLYKLFEKKSADAHYKSCLSCSMLYMLFEKKNADAIRIIRVIRSLK